MTNEPHFILPNEDGIKGALLDAYLEAGYYRMQHLIFTTNQTQLAVEGDQLPVFWLRTPVKNITENKAAIVIRKKCVGFEVIIKRAIITKETEALYTLYIGHVNFSASPTCREYLHQDEIENPYDSWMIEIRDNSLLIAVGFFDLGKNAIAGILNFYHPAYNKYSLGKYLILQKIDFALANNILFYYTGYISTGITKFDYKIFPDAAAIEVYLPVERQWIPYLTLGKPLLQQYYNYYFT
jgi:arginine-tRNA-protein transferase